MWVGKKRKEEATRQTQGSFGSGNILDSPDFLSPPYGLIYLYLCLLVALLRAEPLNAYSARMASTFNSTVFIYLLTYLFKIKQGLVSASRGRELVSHHTHSHNKKKIWTNWKSTTLLRSSRELRLQDKMTPWKLEREVRIQNPSSLGAGAAGASVCASVATPKW